MDVTATAEATYSPLTAALNVLRSEYCFRFRAGAWLGGQGERDPQAVGADRRGQHRSAVR